MPRFVEYQLCPSFCSSVFLALYMPRFVEYHGNCTRSRNRVTEVGGHGGRLKRMRKVKPTRGTAIFALFRDPSFLEVPETTFFSSKIKNDPRHGGICCSRRHIKMASQKRQPRDGANFAPSHFFAKKRKIDSFPSLMLPKKCEKRECRRAKMASRM